MCSYPSGERRAESADHDSVTHECRRVLDRGQPGENRDPNARHFAGIDADPVRQLQAAYLVVYRKQTTMLQDPFSLGYCVIFRFENRVGGSVVCANACCLLRIK
jgi:hypothetical protein